MVSIFYCEESEKMRQEKVEIPCENLTLEGIFALPEGQGPFGIVIVCHPHPLYGGNMDNNVVLAVCRGVIQKGLAALRFNFRGVGRSKGRFGQGIGERKDVKEAISFIEKRKEINPKQIGLCGYSFGSSVTFPVAVEDERVQAVAGISPFVQPPDLLNNYTRPKLFLSGSLDDYVSHEELENLVNVMPEPREIKIVPGVGHFWWGTEDKIILTTGEFFKGALSQNLQKL